MALLRKKLAGSTLVESLVAMVIILISAGISSVIYVNLMESQKSRLKLKANLMLGEIAFISRKENRYFDETIDEKEFVIHKLITKYQTSEGASVMSLRAIDPKGMVLAEYRELILQNDEKEK
jgi:hypothetical protein